MSERQTRIPPFGLDMAFTEALERYIGTNRKEALHAELGEPPASYEEGTKVEKWEKKLSTTDAQQETSGGLVPYLRLTSGSLKGNEFQTWFRQDFFAPAPWQEGEFNHKPVEQAHIAFDVTVKGVQLGPVTFQVTHDDTRQNSNDAPNTWLHWPDQVANILHKNDFTGCPVVLTRDEAGTYSLEIQ